MRFIWAAFPLVLLGACATEIEPRREGVGFGSYSDYLAERQRLAGESQQGVRPGLVVSPESTVAADIDFRQPAQTQPGQAQPEIAVAGSNPTPEQPPLQSSDPDNPAISDEQNFDAVSARESIESDRERLERQRAQFQVIGPTDLPRRPGVGPNIVAYALRTNHALGTPMYQRGPFNSAAASARACARYLTADLAQEAFLAAGGPQRDPKRLDPDGDGYACKWDPAPYRLVRN